MPQSTDQGQRGPQKNIPPPPWTNPIIQAWAAKLRPLSDIRELTEPSLIDSASRNSEILRAHTIQRSGSLGCNKEMIRQAVIARSKSQRSLGRIVQATNNKETPTSGQPLDTETQSDHSSAYSLSLENVPSRSSLRHRIDVPPHERRIPHLRLPVPPNPSASSTFPLEPPLRVMGSSIPGHRDYCSPVKKPLLQHRGIGTFIRTTHPNIDLLDYPTHRHPRLTVELHVGSSLFVGGASIDGNVRITVNELERSRHRRQLAISRISIDLLGVEEASGGKRAIFLNLASELINSDRPPPYRMVESLKQNSPIDPFWLLTPSISSLPFSLTLPLEVGPPPFQSKHARIRYMLAATVLIRDQGKQYLVRSSRGLSVLSVYDRKYPANLNLKYPDPNDSSRKSSHVSSVSTNGFRRAYTSTRSF
jgi:hypothetical protein